MTVCGAAVFAPRVIFRRGDPLPIAIGWPLGYPRATQASRKGHPWVDLAKYFCLQQKSKRPGGAEIIG
jgi:hypothetical protein